MKCKLQISYINNISQDSVYQIQLPTTNAGVFLCWQHMNQMPHFQSQDTSSEWSETKIFYIFSFKT